MVIAGANIPDVQLLEETLGAIVVDRPEVTPDKPQHLCLDKGYDQPLGHEVVERTDYTSHIRPRGEKEEDRPPKDQRHPARRWLVERTLAWLQKGRGILIRYDKKAVVVDLLVICGIFSPLFPFDHSQPAGPYD